MQSEASNLEINKNYRYFLPKTGVLVLPHQMKNSHMRNGVQVANRIGLKMKIFTKAVKFQS